MSNDRARDITKNRDDQKIVPYAYSPAIRELAFYHWIKAGQNAVRAHRALLALCQDADADDDLPLPSELPDSATISRWARKDGWEAKLVHAVADHFPAISARQAARLITQTDTALDEWDAIMSGERDQLRHPAMQARVALIAANLQLRGLGTAGARGGVPSIAARTAGDDPSSLTADERQQRHLARIEAFREARRQPG